MKTELKLALETAIESLIEKNCEGDLWNGYIHPTLYRQMAEAAGQVFDASMDAQAFLVWLLPLLLAALAGRGMWKMWREVGE